MAIVVYWYEETDDSLWAEFIQIAREVAPELLDDLQYVKDGGAAVERYRSGKSVGMLHISMAPTKGRDYHRWRKLNCGPGRKMYEKVQAESKRRWEQRQGSK